jgi:FkbM family methyltransferase
MTFDPLESVLAELGPVSRVRERETTAFRDVAGDATDVVIAGSGQLGRAALPGVRRAGFHVVAFSDNNQARWGQTIDGVRVMGPADAIARYNTSALFLVAIYNGTPVREQLRGLGCRRVVPYPLFFWQFSRDMQEETRLDLPHRILESVEPMRAGYGLLADDRSRLEFAAQIAWRCTLDYARLPFPDPPSTMYFAPDIVRLGDGESLVDCGAFDGDSIRMFLERTGRRFNRIHAFEPDPANRAALQKYLESLPAADRGRIAVLPFGVADFNGTVSFDSSGTAGSHISKGAGTGTMECRRLDDVLDDVPVTIVKMDIEGAEPDALRGARTTIRRARPVLAVCAYHKSEHLWTLPSIIAEAMPEYRILLRRYAEECWETVYYAVAPGRVAG